MGAADSLHSKLDAGEVVIMDGGTGTEIPRRGVPLCPATWSGRATLTHPDLIRQIHEDYIRAGAEVIITNTFSTSRSTLEAGGLSGQTAEINRLAVRLAQEARDNVPSAKSVAVAGSMSTFVPKLDPTVTPSYEAALADYREQAQILAGAGVDFFILEMLIRTLDARAAVEAASETGLPIWVGYTIQRDNGGLYLGIRGKHVNEGIGDAVDAVASMGVSAFFIMHSAVEDTLPGLQVLRQHTSLPIGAYAHSMELSPGQENTGTMVVRPSTAGEYLGHAQDWVKLGAQVVGGCCGVTPDHIRALSNGLPSRLPS
jgi:S-methylmethionine-dependent homocysteine/selenocysteine methylase